MKLTIYLAFILLWSACDNTPQTRLRLDIDNIQSISITRFNSTLSETRIVQKINVPYFVERWNHARKTEACFDSMQYLITVVTNDKTVFNFNCKNGNIKLHKGDCYSVGDKHYFDQMWQSNKIVCPKGHTNFIIPIVYGLPTRAAYKEARANKVIHGGCIIEERSPNWYCEIHQISFGEFESN